MEFFVFLFFNVFQYILLFILKYVSFNCNTCLIPHLLCIRVFLHKVPNIFQGLPYHYLWILSLFLSFVVFFFFYMRVCVFNYYSNSYNAKAVLIADCEVFLALYSFLAFCFSTLHRISYFNFTISVTVESNDMLD